MNTSEPTDPAPERNADPFPTRPLDDYFRRLPDDRDPDGGVLAPSPPAKLIQGAAAVFLGVVANILTSAIFSAYLFLAR